MGGGVGGGSGGGSDGAGGERGSSFAGVDRGNDNRGDRGGIDNDRNPDGVTAQYIGPRRRLPNPAPPPFKKPSTRLSETHIPQLSQHELGSAFSQEVPSPPQPIHLTSH